MIALSVVVPLFNEQDSVRPLVQQLLAAVRPLGLTFELVLVDDGSKDRTAAVLSELSAAVPELVAAMVRLFAIAPADVRWGLFSSQGRELSLIRPLLWP